MRVFSFSIFDFLSWDSLVLDLFDNIRATILRTLFRFRLFYLYFRAFRAHFIWNYTKCCNLERIKQQTNKNERVQKFKMAADITCRVQSSWMVYIFCVLFIYIFRLSCGLIVYMIYARKRLVDDTCSNWAAVCFYWFSFVYFDLCLLLFLSFSFLKLTFIWNYSEFSSFLFEYIRYNNNKLFVIHKYKSRSEWVFAVFFVFHFFVDFWLSDRSRNVQITKTKFSFFLFFTYKCMIRFEISNIQTPRKLSRFFSIQIKTYEINYDRE